MSHPTLIASFRRAALLAAPLTASIALAVVLFPTAAALAQDAQPATPPTGDSTTETKAIDPKTVVAKINGQDITRQDVIDSAESLPPQLKANIDQLFPQLTDRLIGLRLLADQGRSEKLQDDPEVKAIMARLEDEAIRQVLITRLLKEKVTDEAIKARYEQNLKDHPPQDEVKASHILVKTEAEASKIIAQLKKGGDFAKIAKEKSIDKGSAVNGGELGFFTQDAMVKEFGDAAFAMKPGEISQKPVQSQFGWHVIKVEDRRKQTPPALDAERDQIRQLLSEEAVQQQVADLRAKAKVEVFNPDGTPKAQ
ncbi:peptidylprolyl isomerase [Dongia soli]|uniref:Parvulin-like PPIase n=1 Tax=Dongia soli TaxID=600628 RepID=A0ABU5EEW9_9PROT|nr:peptidylprolyl isomerase [Dongia soli]MDY0884013.1 peptidylprolyl isomerase [Dongia soli]